MLDNYDRYINVNDKTLFKISCVDASDENDFFLQLRQLDVNLADIGCLLPKYTTLLRFLKDYGLDVYAALQHEDNDGLTERLNLINQAAINVRWHMRQEISS